MSAHELVRQAYRQSVEWHGASLDRYTDRTRIVEALTDAGVADDATGEASLEARIDNVIAELALDHDGGITPEMVADGVCRMLGLCGCDPQGTHHCLDRGAAA